LNRPADDEAATRALVEPSPRRHRPRQLRWGLERNATAEHVMWYRLVAICIGLALALVLGPLFVDQTSGEIREHVWQQTFGTSLGIGNVLSVATPLILTGLAACVPYRLGVWNIGADGQMLVGAWLAAAIAFEMSDLSGTLLIPLMLAASFIGGALWILGPALARMLLGINEIITTLMLNFVAIYWLIYWAAGPWRDPLVVAGVRSRSLPEDAEISEVTIGSLQVQWGFFLAVGLAFALWLFFRHAKLGYEVSMLRESERVARYAGIPARKRMLQLMLIGGAMGGLAGAVAMGGTIHRYSDALSNNTGYAGVVVAILAAGSELAVVLTAIVFAALIVGGDGLRTAGISADAVFALLGVILLLAALGDVLGRYRLVRRTSGQTPQDGPESNQVAAK
jgi:simple sugar transport system permease protein